MILWPLGSETRTQSGPLFPFFRALGSLKSPFEPKKGTLFIPRLLLGLGKLSRAFAGFRLGAEAEWFRVKV